MGMFFSIFVLVILGVILLGTVIAHITLLNDEGGILDEKVLEDYLNTLSDNYEIYRSEYTISIVPLSPSTLRKQIEVSYPAATLLLPYYIQGVGVIPIWSKSKKRIDAMFESSPKVDWKRKKLGL